MVVLLFPNWKFPLVVGTSSYAPFVSFVVIYVLCPSFLSARVNAMRKEWNFIKCCTPSPYAIALIHLRNVCIPSLMVSGLKKKMFFCEQTARISCTSAGDRNLLYPLIRSMCGNLLFF